MWHELVLCGVGGRTVEEAQDRMSYAEFTRWVDYRNRRGSLFVGNRLESGFALIAWLVSRAAGGKAEMMDFMPHAETPEATIEDVVKVFGGVNRG